MKQCHQCGKDIPEAGWGATAMRQGDGQYIHYDCVPPPPITDQPPPLAAIKLPPPEAGPTYISIRQAAQLLGVSPSTIRARIRTGLLPAKRLKATTTIRIDRAAVLDQLEDYGTL